MTNQTRTGAVTRESIIRDIATQVARRAHGYMTFEEAEGDIESVMPHEDVLATLGQEQDPMVAVLRAAEAAVKRGWPRTLAVMETKAGSTALIEVGGNPSPAIREALEERLTRGRRKGGAK